MQALRIVAPALAGLLIMPPGRAAAQTFHGGIRGTVRDRAGVIADAAVELIEEPTRLERTTVSNGTGEYVFANLLPGLYRLRARRPGYKVYERGDLRIGTQTFLAIDVVLQPGDVAEHVTVRADAALVEAPSASLSTLLTRTTLDDLPSAGRNVFFMATTTPTVVATGDSQFVRQQDQSNSSLISIGGGPRRDNSYVLDGVPIVDILNRASFIPGYEAIEEMRVQVNAYDAEIGRTSGGVFNATARSGSNQWHGGALYQNRPRWAQGQLFFARQNDLPKPDSYYHLYGGSFGGPMARDRTFFWASTEGYRTRTTRSTVLVLPTPAERSGDFSRSGVTIYDPLTTRRDPSDPTRFIRDPFPGNQIPANRLNPVALALLKHVPLPASGQSRPAVADIVDRADQITGKATHRWSDRLTTTGLYAWYESMEPDARFYGRRLFENGADPGDGALVRRVNLIGINTLWTATDASVVHVRFGSSGFLDDNRPAAFDPAPLGFDSRFLGIVPLPKFPSIGVADYGRGGSLLGDRDRSTATYYSRHAGASVSTLHGRHTLKFGGDYRKTGVRFQNVGGTGGYTFNRDFTSGPNPNAPTAAAGDGFASFLLGYPASGGISIGSPIDIYLDYWSGFVQDDVRVRTNLTVTAGLRYEFEQGLREAADRIVVGWNADTGGLRYAGVGRAPTHQGRPSGRQFGPRAGLVYAIGDRSVVRGGYGLFWAPTQGISADEWGSGTTGYNQSTSYVPTKESPFIPCPTCSLTNPFPSGIDQPRGNTLGALTGVGGTSAFVDPGSRLASFHRYSAGIERELPRQFSLGVTYIGARGRHLTGGVSGGPLNINQLDPKHLALGSALQDPVANPFFNTSRGVGILSGPTVPRGQLLRPYPQFDGVYTTRASLSRSRYDALVVTAERRLNRRWAARANYTWSRLLDSQFSESNFFAGGSAILNNYDVEREYGLSVLDTPHRLNLSASFELAGGVTVSATGSYQSGFPVSVLQSPNNSNLLGSSQRPNIVGGVNPRLPGDPESNYDPACGCIRWLNPMAWSQAPPFTFGNAPRTDGRARTPVRRSWDLAVQKSQRLAGRTLSLRAELINVFDTADLRGPGIVFGDASFGQIREAGGFPRMLQILARVAW